MHARRTVERKQATRLAVRIGVSVLMLVVLIAKVPSFDPATLVPTWSVRTAIWLGVAAVLTLAGIALSALRWQKVLDALDIHTRLPRLMSLYLAGQFASNVLPPTIAAAVPGVWLAGTKGRPPFASLALIAFLRFASSALLTRMLAVRLFRSMRTRSPVFNSARPPPTAASGEALRIDGEPEVPDCRPSP